MRVFFLYGQKGRRAPFSLTIFGKRTISAILALFAFPFFFLYHVVQDKMQDSIHMLFPHIFQYLPRCPPAFDIFRNKSKLTGFFPLA